MVCGVCGVLDVYECALPRIPHAFSVLTTIHTQAYTHKYTYTVMHTQAYTHKYTHPPTYTSPTYIPTHLLQVEHKRKQGAYSPTTLAIGVARIGADDQQIVAAPLGELQHVDFGPPLHSLVIAGDMHPLEEQLVQRFGGGGGDTRGPE